VQPRRCDGLVQPGEGDPWLGPHRARLGIDIDDRVHLGLEVEDDCLVDRLARQAGSRTPRENGDLPRRAVLEDRPDVSRAGRSDDADRLPLIDARVGGVQPARVLVKADLALDAIPEVGGDLSPLDWTAPIVVGRSGIGRGIGPFAAGVHGSPLFRRRL
jgi:hypothetical protein